MEGDDIKKRVKQREDMFLRRLFGTLAKMAKEDGTVDAFLKLVPNGDVHYGIISGAREE